MALYFIIGYMGSGKSTVAKKMATLLNYQLIDLDTYIENEQQQTIAELFESAGEKEFRAIEHGSLKKLMSSKNTIIACGGGTPCYFNNVELMNLHGITIYIQMETEALVKRLINANSKRPLIANKSEAELRIFINEQLKVRAPFYERAHYIVNGINLNAKELIAIANK
ncbi:MAG: shikimate kinase [Bacteroidia bacterium]